MTKSHKFRVFRAVVITVFVIWTLAPIYWLINTSLKTNDNVLKFPPSLIPEDPTLDSYSFIFSNFGTYLMNSIVTSVGSTILSIFIGLLAAYSVTRFKFPKGLATGIGFIILSVRMMLPIVFIVPLFQIYQSVGLYNTQIGLILAYSLVNMPFVFWLLTSYLSDVPVQLDEAAMIDGCGRLRSLFTVIVPLASPGIATTAVMAMIFTWNDLIFGLYLTGNASAMTLPARIVGFLSQYQTFWSEMAAAGVIAIIPMVVFLLFIQRYLVKGLTAGAVK